MVMEIEMSDFEGVRELLFGGPLPEVKPRFNTIIAYKKAGRAGITKTQQLMRRKSPKQMPKWYWETVEHRPSWKHATDHQARFYSISLVTDPLPELEFGRGIPYPKVVSVEFTTEQLPT